MSAQRSAPRSIRTAIASLAVFAGALALTGGSAVAAAPEQPETISPATAITASSATANGVLNPGGPSEGGGYRFSYRQSSSECEPEGTFRPELPALALGKAKEEVSVSLTGLEPNREYTFCVIASNLLAESTSGLPVTFKTLGEAPSVDEETASVGSTGASLGAQINPNNEATNYVFEYATKATGETLEGTIVEVPGAEPLSAELGDRGASVPRVEGLTPGTTYFYRVVAENEQSKEEGAPIKGKVQSFTTVPVPSTEAATAVTATTATFHGQLAPLNSVDTTYSFDYRVGGECVGEGSTAPEDAGTGSGSTEVSSEATGLQPSMSYSVCLVSSNVFGSEVDPALPPVSFTTLAAPPSIDSETATVTPFEATLEALLNANNQETTYKFEYATNAAMSEHLGTLSPPEGTPPLQGYGDQGVAAQTGQVLVPGTTYFYRVVAENAAHEKTEGEVKELMAPALEKPVIEPGSATVSAIGSRSARFEALVNPDYQETSWVFEYATDEAMTENVGTVSGLAIPAVGGAQGVSVLATGLLPAREYFFRITATNSTGTTQGPVVTPPFTTLAVPLVEETEPEASEVTQHTALIGDITINPQIEEPQEEASYYVLYGATESYGHALPAPTHASAGYGLTGREVAPVQLYGLTPGTTYHFAIVAHNANGTNTSHDYQFTTLPAEPLTAPPAIGSASAQFVNENSAIIESEVNPEGLQASYEVQYGTNTAYGSSTPPAGLAPFTSAQGTITALTGLKSDTTYHYRLVASSQAGTTDGPDHTFKTTGAAQGVFTPFTVPTVPQFAIAPFTFPPEEGGVRKPLTNKQKLAAALKACAKKPKAKRAACRSKAHRRYDARHKTGHR